MMELRLPGKGEREGVTLRHVLEEDVDVVVVLLVAEVVDDVAVLQLLHQLQLALQLLHVFLVVELRPEVNLLQRQDLAGLPVHGLVHLAKGPGSKELALNPVSFEDGFFLDGVSHVVHVDFLIILLLLDHGF